MAIKNKKKYMVYLDEKNTEFLKEYLETTKNKGGLSGLFDGYVTTMTRTLKVSGYKPGTKLTFKQLFKIAKNGFSQDPA